MRVAYLLTMALVSLALPAAAQKPVYKCVTAGKATYSDEPCIGAQVVDVTPTQGADKWTGTSRKSTEIQRIELRNGISDAIQPLTGMNRNQFAVAVHRQKLPARDRAECLQLDQPLAIGQSKTNRNANEELQLYKLRKRFGDLNC